MIYRSSDPAVLAAWEAFEADTRRFAAEVRELQPPVTYDPKPFVEHDRWVPGAQAFVGWECWSDESVPDGWKYERKRHVLTPKLGTAVGRRAAAEFPRPVARIALPGMPSTLFEGLSLVSPGIKRDGDEMVVDWGKGRTRDGIDPCLWTADIDVPTVVFT